MKTIPLTQGKVALVDDADYAWLNQWKWQAMRNGYTFYVARRIHVAKDKKRLEQMHRLILGLQSGDNLLIDHIDGDGLNNQRVNLRVCTIAQNRRHSKKRMVGTSRYKGVCWHRGGDKWQSTIRVNKKQIHLGLFDSETSAASAYNRAASKHFGEFALLNPL